MFKTRMKSTKNHVDSCYYALLLGRNVMLLQRCFSNNVTTLYRRLLIDVFFATLLQRRGMVERRRDIKTITLQRGYDVVCLLGNSSTSKPYNTEILITFASDTFRRKSLI